MGTILILHIPEKDTDYWFIKQYETDLIQMNEISVDNTSRYMHYLFLV